MSFTKQQKNELLYYTADHLSSSGGLLHGFSSRLGGVSEGALSSLNLGRTRGDREAHVRENYRRFGEALGAPIGSLVLCQQVHSARVELVSRADALPDLYAPCPFEADGMVSNERGLFLAVFYADCIPVLLYDPVAGAIGAVHSGWRGTARGIAGIAVQRMQEAFGCRAENIRAAIGPGICSCCFETHEDVPTALRKTYGQRCEDFIRPLPLGKFQVDLRGMIASSLQQVGLRVEQIADAGLCTCCHPEQFWSHRRLGEARGNQAALIALR